VGEAEGEKIGMGIRSSMGMGMGMGMDTGMGTGMGRGRGRNSRGRREGGMIGMEEAGGEEEGEARAGRQPMLLRSIRGGKRGGIDTCLRFKHGVLHAFISVPVPGFGTGASCDLWRVLEMIGVVEWH
jgi:hypothetical protein